MVGSWGQITPVVGVTKPPVTHLGVSKNTGVSPKMDGEKKGNPLFEWMIWGDTPLFSETTPLFSAMYSRREKITPFFNSS